MRITKDDRDKAAATLMRGELSTVDELCLRELVTCYGNKEAIDETIYSTGCDLLQAAYDAPFYPDELGDPVRNPAFSELPEKEVLS